MQINGEDVEQVTDFAQLQLGDTVYFKPCGRCSAEWHRFLLIKIKYNLLVSTVFGIQPTPRAFEVLPRPRCCPGVVPVIVDNDTVDVGSVYRVVDPKRSEGHQNAEKMVDNHERAVARRMSDYINEQIARGVADRPYSKP